MTVPLRSMNYRSDVVDDLLAKPEKTKRQQYVEEHFPTVDYGGKPLGPKVLVQLRTVVTRSAGGLYIPEETRDFNKSQTCLGIVREIGALAFRNRETMEPWPEGVWAKVGDIVMVERHVGRRFEVPIPDSDDKALFVVLPDHSLDWIVRNDFQEIQHLFDQII